MSKRIIDVKAKNLTELSKKVDKKRKEGYVVLGVIKSASDGKLIATMTYQGIKKWRMN